MRKWFLSTVVIFLNFFPQIFPWQTAIAARGIEIISRGYGAVVAPLK